MTVESTSRRFAPVSTQPDFPAIEHALLNWWQKDGIVDKYLARNDGNAQHYSFIDGPITANNPMGVHHGWGRTYKDLYQRFHTMLGEEQRYQNGFDCQGLWVEVEVEKELGFKSKRDIETFGIAEFVNKCKERVLKYAGVQTQQSIRLGYWMDWDNSYYTMSDENNYTIWFFLKTCFDRGWIYKGRDVLPWCARCGTALTENEMLDQYFETTHTSPYVKLPLVDEPGAALLVWTTTPWTLAANVAAAVKPDLVYARVRQDEDVYYLAQSRLSTLRGDYEMLGTLSGSDLVGRRYRGPFDELPAQDGVAHRVIAWDEVSDTEGTGIVHIAPGCGREDFSSVRTRVSGRVGPDRRERKLRRRLRISHRYARQGGGEAGTALTSREGAALSDRGVQASLSALLALRHGAGIPPGERVVHQRAGASAAPDRRRESDHLDPGVLS